MGDVLEVYELDHGDIHSRVRSVRGPAFCCKECSLDVGDYVAWPCSSMFLAAADEFGKRVLNKIRDDLGIPRG